MKILYMSVHSVLEYDELRLFTELDTEANAGLNLEVFSLGAYTNPTQSGDYMRSVIPKGRHYPKLHGLAMQCDKDNLHPELVSWADVIMMMHNYAIPGSKTTIPWIVNNWQKFKDMKKRVVFRSIGQCVPQMEKELRKYREQGVQIVRYSPMEDRIPDYAGHDAIIRFYKDDQEFKGWTGEKKFLITVAQSFKKRGEHLGYHVFEKVAEGFPAKVYGTENEDLGEMNGGSPSYVNLKGELRQNRVFFYYGTQPAPYTLSLIEAMMTGIPVVAAGPRLRDTGIYRWPQYEIPEIITNGVNGYVSDSIDELRGYVHMLLEDEGKARAIGEAGRNTALKLFNRKDIMKQWADFLSRG